MLCFAKCVVRLSVKKYAKGAIVTTMGLFRMKKVFFIIMIKIVNGKCGDALRAMSLNVEPIIFAGVAGVPSIPVTFIT